jgi:ABC-type sugar transport system ATPase subunit
MSDGERPAAYRLEGLTKIFPGVVAVDRVDLEVREGEIHGVIGKNGAGKSALVGMIAGVIEPTEGSIWIGGEVVGKGYNPALAHRLGVSLIPQEPLFARDLSVTDNLYMGRPAGGPVGLVAEGERRQHVAEIAERLSVRAKPLQKMGELRIEDQQLLAFGKALYLDQARIILLDEITASLTRERKELLLRFLREAVESSGLSITLITHHIREVHEFCHRVTVMRDGRAVHTGPVAGSTEAELARWVVGDASIQVDRTALVPAGRTVLTVRGLTKTGEFAEVDLDLAVGEVVGVAGLDGSGKDAFLAALFGLIAADGGSIAINGRPVRIRSPRDAQRYGIAYLPKKREEQAIVHGRSVEENMLISAYPQLSTRLGLIDRGRCAQIARRTVAALGIKTPGVSADIDTLSGGNRQKVVVGRVATMAPKVFLLDEPTRGVDLGAKPQILRTIREQLAQESGVIVTSESEEELLEVCDRVLVFYKGRVQSVLERGSLDVAAIYSASQGIGAPA